MRERSNGQKNVRVGYLDQHAVLEKGMTIRDVLQSAFQFLYELEENMNRMFESMAEASLKKWKNSLRKRNYSRFAGTA